MKNDLEQKGDKFGVEVDYDGPRTTALLGYMYKLSNLFGLIDKYLLSFLPLKLKSKHVIHEDTIDDCLYIDEDIGMSGETGAQVKDYLRKGKELILSNLDKVSTLEGFDALHQEMTALVNDAVMAVSENLSFDGFACISLDRDDLVRLLDDGWKFFDGPGKSYRLNVVSLESHPQVRFVAEPPFADWISDESDVTPRNGRFRLVRSDFDQPSKWTARPIGFGSGTSVNIVIADLDFLEGLQSSSANASNGLLIGDIIDVKYWIEVEPLSGKVSYYITKVVDHLRADELTP